MADKDPNHIVVAPRPDLSTKEAEEKAIQTIAEKQANLVLQQMNAAPPALQRLIQIADGSLEIEEEVVTKDGDVIPVKKKPNHRIMLDANIKLVDFATPVKAQKVEHSGLIGIAMLSEKQIDEAILEAYERQQSIPVKGKVVE